MKTCVMQTVHIVKSIERSFGGEGLAAFKLAQYTGTKLIVCSPKSASIWDAPEEFRNHLSFEPSVWRLVRRLISESRSVKLIHIHGVWHFDFFIYLLVAKFLGIRCLISPHGCFGEWAISSKWFKKRIALYLYQGLSIALSNGLVANSSLELGDLRKRFPDKKIYKIRNGVDVANYSSDGSKQISSTGRLTSQGVNFLFLSRLSPVKGVDLLLHAWKVAFGTGSRHKLFIAGEGEAKYVTSLGQLSRALSLENSVEFIGSVSGLQKKRSLSSADVFVLPSYGENFGIVVAEALLSNLPVITTNKTPWVALATESMGWIVDCEVDSLAEALANAVDTPRSKLVEMGQRGHRYVLDNFTWEQASKDAITVYGEILGG